jgi:hypothetical protein
MNSTTRLSLAVIVLCTSHWAAAQNPNCGKFPVMTSKLLDGTSVGVFISEAQFKKAPKWSGSGEPPLSIGRAIEIAEKWGKAKYANYDSARIRGINLSEYGCPGQPSYWYYSIHFAPVKDGRSSYGGHYVVLLLDGTLIEPTKVKDDL